MRNEGIKNIFLFNNIYIYNLKLFKFQLMTYFLFILFT